MPARRKTTWQPHDPTQSNLDAALEALELEGFSKSEIGLFHKMRYVWEFAGASQSLYRKRARKKDTSLAN